MNEDAQWSKSLGLWPEPEMRATQRGNRSSMILVPQIKNSRGGGRREQREAHFVFKHFFTRSAKKTKKKGKKKEIKGAAEDGKM